MIIFIRINVISNKYATLSTERYMMYKDQLLTPLEISRDMYMADWRLQTPYIKVSELYKLQDRARIECQDFYIKFFLD